MSSRACVAWSPLVALLVPLLARSAEPAAPPEPFTLAEGAYVLSPPEGFDRVQPRFNMIEAEFAVPSEGNDAAGQPLPPGRMTVMGAQGGVAANVDRWYGQFTQPDGSETRDKSTSKNFRVAGCTVTVVDIRGTYRDMPGGPFAGGRAVERPDYRMLGAIVETPAAGSYFLKFYGPAATVERHAAGFQKMLEGMVAGR